jgi:hypothetical protein
MTQFITNKTCTTNTKMKIKNNLYQLLMMNLSHTEHRNHHKVPMKILINLVVDIRNNTNQLQK